MKTTKLKTLVACALLFITASAPALESEVLYAFQFGPWHPAARLVQGSDGNFYGISTYGGSRAEIDAGGGAGTVFKVATNGVLTTLVSFTGSNGQGPQAGLMFGDGGDFYSTTAYGGSGLGT